MDTAINTIPKARPDHPVLDFETLRAEGIRHLEHLATEIWTDYNAHDPGITIMELLCYALTDLGYRTRMIPIEDLVAPNDPKLKTWFEATEILPNEPVTELDFRKLLIDVKGVKNAWLWKALPCDEPITLCKKRITFPLLPIEIDIDREFIDHIKIRDFMVKYMGYTPEELDATKFPEKLKMAESEIFNFIKFADASSQIQAYLQVITKEEIARRIHPDLIKVLVQLGSSCFDKDTNTKTGMGGVDYLAQLILKHLFYYQNGAYKEINNTYFYYPPGLPLPAIVVLEAERTNSDFNKFKLTALQNFATSLDPSAPPQIELSASLEVFSYLEGRDNPQSSEAVAMLSFLRKSLGYLPGAAEIIRPHVEQSLLANGLPPTELPNVLSVLVGFILEYSWIGPCFREVLTFQDPVTQSYPFQELRPLVAPVIQTMLTDTFYIPDPKDAKDYVDQIYQYYFPDPGSIGYFLTQHFCEFGYKEIQFCKDKNPDAADQYPIRLNGLYRIVIDIDEDIDTANTKQVNTVVERAMKRLHAHRALCEDFTPPYVVEARPVHLCINIDVDPDADEQKVMAEVIWALQEYLTPSLRFRTFQEMHATGIPCDEIYRGPLLNKGFLLDQEVESAYFVEKYNHSDLLRIALSIPGVLGIRELKVNPMPEDPLSFMKEIPVYFVQEQDQSKCQTLFIKRIIDICESCFFVNKGPISFQLSEVSLEEHLEWLQLTRHCELCLEPGKHLPKTGFHRPDLADYRSLQYDLPAVYGVGDYQIGTQAPVLRQSQTRHLQAYLAFYDQILAAYLNQLGQVSKILSVQQDTTAPMRMLPALYNIPGIRELIDYQAEFTVHPQDWDLMIAQLVPEADRADVRAELDALITVTTHFSGFLSMQQQLGVLLSDQYAGFIAQASDFLWARYVDDEQNNYMQALKSAAETGAQRQRRHNALLDHMLARFGETFTTYVHAILRPDAEPEDTPWRQDFEEYLHDKANFLREVATLGSERGKAYNYKKFLPDNHQPDVWNTLNMAGVKKRVCRLVGIDDCLQASLIPEPPYRLDVVKSAGKKGKVQYRIVLRKRLNIDDTDQDNPENAGILMYSSGFSTQKKAQNAANELYQLIWKTDLYKAIALDTDPDKFNIVFTGAGVTLKSELMGQEEAKSQLLLIQDLVKPGAGEKEGFHLLEHILLRPNDFKDHLLKIPLGCTPSETPYDPYSFWVTVVLPGWTQRFKHSDFRYFFEQTFRTELPAHIAVRFCWLDDIEWMYKFEDAYKRWMVEKAKCKPNECHVTEAANILIDLLNVMPCSCYCPEDPDDNRCDDCHPPKPPTTRPYTPATPNDPPVDPPNEPHAHDTPTH